MYISYFNKFIKYFGTGRKIKLAIFTLMGLVAGMLEFVGITLIYPFALAMVKPEILKTGFSALPEFIQQYLYKIPEAKLALLIGLIAMVIFILKNIYMMIFIYFQSRFLEHWKMYICNMIMKFYLFAPYNVIQKISESDKLYILNVVPPNVTGNFCQRYITLIINLIIVISILSLILIKFFTAGVVTITFIVISLVIQNKLFKGKITAINSNILKITRYENSVTYTNINCIKEVKIQNVEEKFLNKYKDAMNKLTKIVSKLSFYSGIPPYTIETLIVISLILLEIVISHSGQQSINMLAALAMIVAAIFRIAPALNRIQTSILNLPTGFKFLQNLIEVYEEYNIGQYSNISATADPIKFNRKLEFKNVCFSYEKNLPILKNISFTIDKGDFVGIIGLSGVGKSTLADIITGLLSPDSGEIYVDDAKIDIDKFSGFSKNIGYVQQEFDMLECSFRENIAWDENPENIDDQKVISVLKQVRLWDEVLKHENTIYDIPFIGETGLSRGQKQRLAIARALYKNPEILLFDEATSALDVKVENEITEMLKNVCSDKTIIAIAHRLSTLQACNKLIYMKDGTIVDIGTFRELSDKYPEFAELIRLSSIQQND